MRVLLTTDTVGGVWTYALDLARALAPAGVEVLLATKGAPLARDQRRAAEALENVRVFESSFRLEWMDDPWRDVAAAGAWLLELARELRPDVVHLNDYAHGALPFWRPVLVVGHSCVLSWFRAVKGVEAPREWDPYRASVVRGIAGADALVAPSRAMLDALREHYGPHPAAQVIPNARDPRPYLRRAAKEPFVLAAGRFWDEAKNVAALVRAAPRLSWTVHVAGDAVPPDGKQLDPGDVRLLGRLIPEELAGWLARASIYALPARYEPFGLSVLEAAHAGCALVLGDVPSLRESWDGAARFVDPGDEDALVAAIERLSRDRGEREDLARRARARAAGFKPAVTARAYLALYEGLIAAGRRGERFRCAS